MSFFPLEFAPIQVNRLRFVVSLIILAVSLLLGPFLAQTEASFLFFAILGVGLFVLVLTHSELATLAVTFSLYSNALVVAATFHGVPSIIAISLSFFLLIPFADYLIKWRREVIVTPALVLMLLYLAVLLTSTLLAGSVEDSSSYIITFLTEGLVLFFLFSNVIRTPTTLRRVVWVILLVGGLMGALTIYQEVTRSYNNDFGGFARIDQGLGFGVGEDIFGKIRRQRTGGPIGEPNRYAQVLLVLVPFAFFMAKSATTRLLRLLALAAGLFILGGVLLTFSRGAALALLGLLFIALLWGYIRLRHLVLIVLTLIILIITIAPDYLIRLNSIRGLQGFFTEDGQDPDGAIRGRATENLAALYTFLDHPVLGVGPGEFTREYSQKVGNSLGIEYLATSRRAHSLYLETAADTGVLGLVSFMAIVAWTLARLWSLRRACLERRPDLADLATAFISSLLAYLLSAFFLHLAYQRYYWFLLAVANAAIYVLHYELTRPRSTEPSGGLLIVNRVVEPL